MIVTSSIGVDKLTLTYREYTVKDASNSGLLVMPGTIDLDTGTTTDRTLFIDRGGVGISGVKAVRNTEYYQATITAERGLVVQLNPSKPYHPYNLVDDDQILQERVATVFKDLQAKGIKAPWQGGYISRIDIARNVLTAAPVSYYNQVWPWLKMKRATRQTQYPDGYGTGNNSTGVIFYNKGLESGQYTGDNLLRGELQLKKNRAVVNLIGCKHYGQIVEAGISSIQDQYRHFMTERVLRVKDGDNVLHIQYEDHLQILKSLIRKNPRTAVNKYIQLLGVPDFINLYRSPDNFAKILQGGGLHRMSTHRNLKKIDELIRLHDMVFRTDKNTVGKMIRELSNKLAA